jgi:hypothetical protein
MTKRQRRILDNMPANEREATADAFQWILFMDEVIALFDWPVNARYLATALRDLRMASRSGVANAHEVRLAWQMLLDTAGPILTGRFISSGTWRDYTPYVFSSRNTPSMAILWEGEHKAVVCRVQYRQEVPVGMSFELLDMPASR